MPFLAYQGNKIFYKGKGKGELLLLLHGNSVSSAMLGGEYKHYTRYFRTLLIDYPGHGKSSEVKELPLNFWKETAEAMIACCGALGVHKVNIIGVDGGAMVALNMAILAPKLVKKIIADSAWGETLDKKLAARIGEARDFTIKRFWRAKLAWFLQHGRKYKNVVRLDNELLIKFAESGKKFYHKELSKIECPVMFTAGSKDTMIPGADKIARELASKNPLFSFKIFDGAEHMTSVSQKLEFRALVREYFGK